MENYWTDEGKVRNTPKDPSAGVPCMFEDRSRKQMCLEQNEQKGRQIELCHCNSFSVCFAGVGTCQKVFFPHQSNVLTCIL